MNSNIVALKPTLGDSIDCKKTILSVGLSIIENNCRIRNIADNTTDEIERLFRRTFSYNGDKNNEISLSGFVVPTNYDVIGRYFEDYVRLIERDGKTGQYYTPEKVANYMVGLLRIEDDTKLQEKRFIDIACGSGIFIINAAAKLVKELKSRGIEEVKIINILQNNLFGIDINPLSVLMTKVNLFIFLTNEIGAEQLINIERINFNIYESNSIFLQPLCETNTVDRIKNKSKEYSSGFDYILGNPPYVEAKKLSGELKNICRNSFPSFSKGAFDLYIPFIAECYNILANGGKVCLILPNKFTVANYAFSLRRFLIEHTHIEFIIDLSEMRVFEKADVYPIVILFSKREPSIDSMVSTLMSVTDYEHMIDKFLFIKVPQNFYKYASKHMTLFCLPFDDEFYKKFSDILTQSERLHNYLEIKTTVSFHKKGQRERYINKNINLLSKNKNTIRKYLGGKSYSKKNEVGKYLIDWSGYFINYDEMALKREKIPLPSLSIFEREKIIFCQHSQEIKAVYDPLGEWVTKDVYPIAFLKDRDPKQISLKFFTGLLNSKVFTFFYAVLFKGVQISEGYFHFLPSWMKELPVIIPSVEKIKRVEELVDVIQKENGGNSDSLIEEIDDIFFDIYGFNYTERNNVRKFLRKNNRELDEIDDCL